MESLEDQYGYDESIFVSEIPEHLLCMICTLVLRDPVQILSCGHKACELCFERIKNYSTMNNTELRCPMDRELIDLTDVREDVYLRRVIRNMVVHCYERDRGCTWQGDLSELLNHMKQCQFKRLKEERETETSGTITMNELANRMERCETSLQNKDKEIALLKHQLRNQQQTNEEIQSLKQQVSQLTGKNIEVEQRQQQEKQQLQQDMAGIRSKNEALERQMTKVARKNIELEQRQQQDMADIRSKNEALERQMTKVARKNIELEQRQQQDMADIRSKNEALERQMTKVARKNIELEQRQQQDMADIRSKNEALERQMSQVSQENMELRDNLQQQQEQHEKLKQQQQQEQHEKLKQQQQQEINNLKTISDDQQSKIDELTTGVEKLQKGIAPCGSTISSTSQLSPSGNQSGASFVAKQPVVVLKKKITVEHHNGDPMNVKITKDTHSVEFTGGATTVGARGAVVPPTSKVWYEVKCTGRNMFSNIRVGWCTSDFPTSNSYKLVGNDVNSYSFNPFDGRKLHNGNGSKWGKKLTGNTGVVGVALDLVKGEILFSVDGQWSRPMGVAFKDVPTHIKLFPAFTGCRLSVEYNFGERDFTFGPPDPTFVKLLDVLKCTFL